ncbi:MAG: hypothetical protein EOO68_17200, partial [Moraxellaceae bacterium]
MFNIVHQKNGKVSAWPLLVSLLLLTFFITWIMHQQALRFTQVAFNTQVDDLVQSIQLRMRDHEQLLLGAKGLYEASKSVEREEFHLYINSLNIKKEYPGVQLIGFSQWIKHADLGNAIDQVREEGFPDFKLYPQGERDNYSMIIYIEPFSKTNLPAFGFDMFSEETRRKAMSAAVETNQAKLSGKVILIQEVKQTMQSGSLFYLPIFNKNMPVETASDRWEALEGFVYAAFRMGDLMTGILQRHKLNINFTLYAGESANPAQELYQSTSFMSDNSVAAYSKIVQLNLFGQPWLLHVVSDKEFERQHKSYVPLITLVLGIVINLLLCAIFYVLVNQRQRALLLAEVMTEDVRAKNADIEPRFCEGSEARVGLVDVLEHLVFGGVVGAHVGAGV